ncbi:MAG: L-arabinose isomerase [Bacillota bacterium]
MIDFEELEVWFVTGSQHLYGEEALEKVGQDSRSLTEGLNQASQIPVNIVYKPVVTTREAIKDVCLAANRSKKCIGIITWMHTFSPAKMWINGLNSLEKPFVHLHTQYNEGIPWSEIDMDYMNLNQSAHGGREFGFIASRMKKQRKVIVGHWQDEEVLADLASWIRAAAACHDASGARLARFGDNMRGVAVTEGDKVEAEMKFGYAVDAFGLGDLVEYVQAVSPNEIKNLLAEYEEQYQVDSSLLPGGKNHDSLKEAARIELGMRTFLEEGNFKAFTTNFENLHGLKQLPGLAVQRLMADGYGFGAEGDWKTAALVRAMKVMGSGLKGGTSFMEDYTYHLVPGNQRVLGAHMLEVCESIAGTEPSMEIHPLDIGDREDPVRLVFDVDSGPGLNASIVDLGNRFRLIVNTVDVEQPDQDLPQLPVARALWEPMPDLTTAAKAWILAGGAHHTGFSQALNAQHLEDFAEITDIEYLLIDSETDIKEFKKEIKWNDVYFDNR